VQDQAASLLQKEKYKRAMYGSPRVDHSQRQAYLLSVVNEYHNMAYKALHSSSDMPTNDLKLRGLTGDANEDFNAKIERDGHLHNFLKIGELVETPADDGRGLKVDPLYKVIREEMKANRGEELAGMVNPAVLKPLYRLQTQKWEGIAEKHLEKIVLTTTDVALRIFGIVSEQFGLTRRAKEQLQARILTFQENGMSTAMAKLRELCEHNRTMALQTTDDAFSTRIYDAKLQRFGLGFGRFRDAHPPQKYMAMLPGDVITKGGLQVSNAFSAWVIVDKDNVSALFEEVHPQGRRSQMATQNIQDEIHDILEAYYMVSYF